MTEQRLKVESGPPQHIVDESSAPPPREAPGQAEKAQEAKDKVQQAAAPAKEKAQEVAGQAKQHAQAAAGQAKEKAAAQVDEKSTQVGQQIGSQGDALQGVAAELRNQGKEGPAKVAEQAAEKVKGLGEHLEQADGESLLQTAQDVARDNPAAAAAAGAAAGFVAGRVIKASQPDDPDDGARSAPASDAASADPARPGTGAP